MKKPRSLAAGMALAALAGVSAARAGAGAPARAIDAARSQVRVRVYKSGVFGAFAHNHLIAAPIQRAEITENPPAVEVDFDSRTLKVEDPDGSPGERATVERNMLGPEVLDSQKYPEIRFRSTQVQAEGGGKWEVSGNLTLHGETHPVQFEVDEANGEYRGQAKLKQTEFGIKPIRFAGGAVKVKDQVLVEFEVAEK